MSDETDARLYEIESCIRALARNALSHKRLYLLSQLGKDLAGRLRELKLLQTQTLAEFVKQRMADEFQLVKTGAHDNVQALVKLNSEELPVTASVGTAVQEEPSRYHYRFWAAFSVPLTEGVRYLNLDDFSFSSEPPSASRNAVEVEVDYVAPPSVTDRDRVIRENIERWLTDKKLDGKRFLARPRFEPAAVVASRSRRTALDILIETLDRRQLQNTTLSLDVVADLLKKRV